MGHCCGDWRGKDSSVMVSVEASVWVLCTAPMLPAHHGGKERLWNDDLCTHLYVPMKMSATSLRNGLPLLSFYPATSPSSHPRKVHNWSDSRFRLHSLGWKSRFNRSRSKLNSSVKVKHPDLKYIEYFNVILSPGVKGQIPLWLVPLPRTLHSDPIRCPLYSGPPS